LALGELFNLFRFTVYRKALEDQLKKISGLGEENIMGPVPPAPNAPPVTAVVNQNPPPYAAAQAMMVEEKEGKEERPVDEAPIVPAAAAVSALVSTVMVVPAKSPSPAVPSMAPILPAVSVSQQQTELQPGENIDGVCAQLPIVAEQKNAELLGRMGVFSSPPLVSAAINQAENAIASLPPAQTQITPLIAQFIPSTESDDQRARVAIKFGECFEQAHAAFEEGDISKAYYLSVRAGIFYRSNERYLGKNLDIEFALRYQLEQIKAQQQKSILQPQAGALDEVEGDSYSLPVPR
jgi:hypothetical protein